jgi:hypothetical protein
VAVGDAGVADSALALAPIKIPYVRVELTAVGTLPEPSAIRKTAVGPFKKAMEPCPYANVAEAISAMVITNRFIVFVL